MPICQTCGKKLKNPDSPAHLKSKFHQEKVDEIERKENGISTTNEVPIEEKRENQKFKKQSRKNSIEKQSKEELKEDLRRQLRENLIDDEKYLKIAELETIEIYNDQMENLLIDFLNEEEYQVKFDTLDDFFSIINIFTNILSFERTITMLNRFDQQVLRSKLRTNVFDINIDYLTTTTYGFDLIIKLISIYLDLETFIQFLLELEDFEEFLSKSYYEENEATYNPTLITIEHKLSEALKGDDQDIYNDAINVINGSGTFFEHLKKELQNTFRVNKYIKLKLVGNRTNIYVNDQLFNQCKYLLLNISRDSRAGLRDIESIDDAAERLDRSMEGHDGLAHQGIPPDTEFWGHCSNLQAFAENNYDTRILHRNMAFPLLKRLTEVGDPIAKQVFKQELSKRFESGYPTVIQYLIEGDYLRYLSSMDLDNLLDNILQSDSYYWNQKHKEDIFRRLARQGSKRAQDLLVDVAIQDLKTADFWKVQRFMQNNLQYLDSEKLASVFDDVKSTVTHASDKSTKLSILKTFAEHGVIKARTPLRTELNNQLKDVNLSRIEYFLNEGYLAYLGENEINAVFNDFNFENIRWDINKLRILKRFNQLKVKNAKKVIKKGVHEIFKSENTVALSRIAYEDYLSHFNKEELRPLLNTLVSSKVLEAESYDLLLLLDMFRRQQVPTAKTHLKSQIKKNLKGKSANLIERIIREKYLSAFTKNELKTIYKQINFDAFFTDDVNRGIRIVERFAKQGMEYAEISIKKYISNVFKNPNEQNINSALNKSILAYFSQEELKQIINDKDSKLIEKLFEFLFITRIRTNIRNKIIRFLNETKGIAGPLISSQIFTYLKEKSIDKYCTFVRAKLLTLLDTKDKQTLLRDPKCLLRQFLVKIDGVEYQVDYHLSLNLSNKRISDSSNLKGLNKLTQLKTLDLRNNLLTSITGIGNLVNLKKLRIQGNPISLELIDRLGGVDRYGNARAPQKFVEYSRKIDSGEVTLVKIRSKKVDVFSDELILRNMKITSVAEIKGLTKLKNIKKLDLSHNKLRNIQGLEELTSLKILNLSHNKLTDLSGIEALVNLEELRVYGNEIYSLDTSVKLRKLQILDLDTKRRTSDTRYLKYLFQSLGVEDIKQVCRDNNIRGYSNLVRYQLIDFTVRSLPEEIKRELISNIEMKIISKGIDLAIKEISFSGREYIESIDIINHGQLGVKFTFKGINWNTSSSFSLRGEDINTHEHVCDCRIGASSGFCSHFWVGFIYALKAEWFTLSDWTSTVLPIDLEEKLKSITIVEGKDGNIHLLNEKSDNILLVEDLETRVTVHEAELNQFQRRQYTWEFKTITYYLTYLKNVKLSSPKQPKKVKSLDNILVRFSEIMYNKFKLDECSHVKLTGEVQNDSYLGLMLKSVYVQEALVEEGSKIKKKIRKKKIKESSPKPELVINLREIRDDLHGDWWHLVSSSDFRFFNAPPAVDKCPVNKGDIFIHKEIVPGDRFPSVRYHLVTEDGTRIVNNPEAKDILKEHLIHYVKKKDKMPPNCRMVKEFKNGNVQVNYNPVRNVNFAIKISPNQHDVANPSTFFTKAKTEIVPTQEHQGPQAQREADSTSNTELQQWTAVSHSNPDKSYIVTLHPNGRWSCTCPHHIFRNATCKHIREFMYQ